MKPIDPARVAPTISSATPTPAVGRASLAYKDAKFIDSDEARPLRILAEYLQPLHAFERENIRDTVVFFGSARIDSSGPLGRYYDAARETARLVTEWSLALPSYARRYVVCTGGGPGIMEAANRGAYDAGGRTIGLNIGLPHEQMPNPYITDELSFEFHYFFMRKLWFASLARALIVFPGGFGTLDELCEILTLAQTGKLARRIPVVLYGSDYWNEVINFDALVRHGTISAADVDLFEFADDPATAFARLQRGILEAERKEKLETPPRIEAADAGTGNEGAPDFAHSHTPGE